MKKRTYSNPVGVSRFTGLLLVIPFAVGFLLFTLYPFAASFITGLHSYENIRSPEFTGLSNYRSMITDEDFLSAASVTLRYAAFLVPIKLLVSLLTALLLSLEIKGMSVYRTIFYIPSILGANLAIVIMWQYLFTSNGLINQFLEAVGATPVSWYGGGNSALAMIILLRVWEFGSTMIIFLTRLRDIPSELYDAAKTDGCGAVKALFCITLPQLKNVIFVNLVLQTIAAMQEFNAPYMITGGGPLKKTYTLGMLIYDEMFRYSDPGRANAVSWLLFVVITIIIAVMFKLTRAFSKEDSQ